MAAPCLELLTLCCLAARAVSGTRTAPTEVKSDSSFISILTWELDLRDECGPNVGNAMALSWQEEKAVVIGPIFYVQASIPFSGSNKSIQRELAITLGTSPPSLMNSPCAKFNSTRTELKSVGEDQSYTQILNEPRYNLKKDCGSDLQSITATAFQDEHDQFGNLILHIFAIFSFPKGQNWGGQVAVNMTGDPKSFIVQKPCANGAWKKQTKFFRQRA